MSVTPTIDTYEAVILVLFLVALGVQGGNLAHAWVSELRAIDARTEEVALLGFTDFIGALTTLLFKNVTGVVLAAMLFTTASPLQRGEDAPQDLIVAITTRVMLVLFATGLMLTAGLQLWTRRRLTGRRSGGAWGGGSGGEGRG